MLGRVVELQSPGDAPGLRRRGGLIQRRRPMGVQIVQHHSDYGYARICLIHQPAHLAGKILHGALPGNGHMGPAPARLAGEEQVARSRPRVLVVLAPRTSRDCQNGWAHVGQQLGGGLVETDHRPCRIAGLGLDHQHVIHCCHEFPAHLRNAPLLLPPWFERVFSAAAVLSRGTTTPPDPVPPSCPPAGAASYGRGHREPGCRTVQSVGPRHCRPASGSAVDLVAAPQHLIQALPGVPLLGAEHRCAPTRPDRRLPGRNSCPTRSSAGAAPSPECSAGRHTSPEP